jgi:hypothetical protein
MPRLLLALMPANLLHELGTGRALDNARSEQEEVARTVAVIDALAGRLQPAAPVAAPIAAPVAAPVSASVDERVAA